jgi:putative protease
MMNTHNEYAVRKLQSYGITKVVFNREMSLAQLALIRERTGIEVEYFVHGDMCVAQSGQCLHSGVVFGQSSNRGRCLKPCRWPFEFIETQAGLTPLKDDPGPYKLALNDMCLYLHLPELIQAGVYSFKIEGRMRTADFVSRVVRVYRRAIDRYIADPAGYSVDADDWRNLHENRARDFSTCYAFGNPGASAIGFSGQREPRFFSQAVKEADMTTPAAIPAAAATGQLPVDGFRPKLAVRVADMASLKAAYASGADTAYIGGEAFHPAKPWALEDIAAAIDLAKKHSAALVVTTPRITMDRECNELEQFFTSLENLKPHGVMVSNIGSLALAVHLTTLPLQTDFSFSLFNTAAIRWLKEQGIAKATISLEATYEQITAMAGQSPLPLEMVVHGSLEAMVMDYCLPKAVLAANAETGLCTNLCHDNQYALVDSAGQSHAVKIDQFCRNHVLFAHDLCLLPHLSAFAASGVGLFRIEGQHYSPSHVGQVTAAYRQELDRLASAGTAQPFDQARLNDIAATAPRELGIGVFRYRSSR